MADIPVLADHDYQGTSRPRNMPAPVADGDGVNLGTLKQFIANLNWKDDCRFASLTNINVASPGASVGGGSPSNGDRVFLQNQTAPAENGPWTFNGAAVAMTRPYDFDASAEIPAARLRISEGTNAGTEWALTTPSPITLGTTGLTFVDAIAATPTASETVAGKVELATQAEVDAGAASPSNLAVTPVTLLGWSGAKKKAVATIGNGAATQIDVTHNFNTRDLEVQLWQAGTPWAKAETAVTFPDTNTARFNFTVAPANNSLRVVIIG